MKFIFIIYIRKYVKSIGVGVFLDPSISKA